MPSIDCQKLNPLLSAEKADHFWRSGVNQGPHGTEIIFGFCLENEWENSDLTARRRVNADEGVAFLAVSQKPLFSDPKNRVIIVSGREVEGKIVFHDSERGVLRDQLELTLSTVEMSSRNKAIACTFESSRLDTNGLESFDIELELTLKVIRDDIRNQVEEFSENFRACASIQ